MIASVDPRSGELVALFNPRKHEWREHFCLQGGLITPLTSVGRATVNLLQLNLSDRVEIRRRFSSDRGISIERPLIRNPDPTNEIS